MTKRIVAFMFSIFLSASQLLPSILVWQYHTADKQPEACYEIYTSGSYEEMRNSGDKYLLALLKRTCENNKTASKSLTWQVPVLVKIFESNKTALEALPAGTSERVLPAVCNLYYKLHVTDIFHPPGTYFVYS